MRSRNLIQLSDAETQAIIDVLCKYKGCTNVTDKRLMGKRYKYCAEHRRYFREYMKTYVPIVQTDYPRDRESAKRIKGDAVR
jgi:hypothetical protein